MQKIENPGAHNRHIVLNNERAFDLNRSIAMQYIYVRSLPLTSIEFRRASMNNE